MAMRLCRGSRFGRLVSLAWVALLGGTLLPAAARGQDAGEASELRLTRDDVGYLALLNSRDLKVERLSTRIVEGGIASERSVFDPVFSLESNETQSRTLGGSALSGARVIENETTTWNSGVRARLPSGAVASLDFQNSRFESNSAFLTVNPQYQSSLTFTLTQPLLRGFGPSVTTSRIKVAENSAEMSRYQTQVRVASVLADAESAYWDVALAVKNVEVRERALDLTRQLAKRTEELVTEGSLPEVALLQAKTAVLQREADLLVARNTRRDTALRLKDLLNFAPGETLIVPLDEPSDQKRSIDVAQAVNDALARRPELPLARLDLRNKDVLLTVAKNQMLPQLNLSGSYGWSGLGGEPTGRELTVTVPTTGQTVDVFRTVPPSRADGDYWTALSNLSSGDFSTWRVGLSLTHPLGDVAAKSQLQKAELELRRSEISVKNAEHAITLEVERLASQVQSTFKVIEVARAVREQARRRLDMTQEQFQLGLASLSAVVEAQRDLVTAEQEAWKAVVDYNKVLVLFERATGALEAKYRVDL